MTVSSAQEFTTEVNASVDVCFSTITAFESYPEWFSSIEHSQVINRYRDGLGKVVEYRIDMKLKSIRYVLEYEYEKPTHLVWHSVDGDIEAIEGRYLFQRVGAKVTRATCRQAVSFGFWVPGPIRKLMERQALQQSVLEFKAAAESAASAAGTAKRRPRRKG